jgi:hypothetical protein
MITTAIVCTHCQRVVAVGAQLPATCVALVPEQHRAALTSAELEAHPMAHRDCIELEVTMPEGGSADVLGAVTRTNAEQIAAMAEVFRHIRAEHPGTR